MSSLSSRWVMCPICYTVNNVTYQSGWYMHGTADGYDLDMRTPGSKDFLFRFNAQECSHCGYAARRIEELPAFPEPREFIASPKYRDVDGLPIENPLTRRFYRWHLCAVEEGNFAEATAALVRAAWSCDDDGNSELAALFRTKAVEMMDKVGEQRPLDEMHMLQRADLLRRSGQFERVLREYSGFTCSKLTHQHCLALELEKAGERDAGSYSIQEAWKRFGSEEKG